MELFNSGEKTAYLITNVYYREYFSGVSVSEGILLLTKNNKFYFTDARYFSAFKEKAKDKVVPKLLNRLGDVRDCLIEQGIETLYLDYDNTTLSEYNTYKKFGLNICDCSQIVKEARSVKTEKEIEYIRKSCEICQKSFYEVLPLVKVGMTEKELKDLLEKRFFDNGADGVAFDTIVAFGEGSAVPHHETSDRALRENEVILIDTGCKYKGYCSDYTRTFFFGRPSEKFIKSYNAVLSANLLAEEKITSGMDTATADGIARDYLKESGLDEYFTHSLGHGLGLEIHEYPTLSKRRKSELKENSVFTVEPGVYIDGEFGIRIEDTVAIIGGKTKRLFTDDKKLLIIK